MTNDGAQHNETRFAWGATFVLAAAGIAVGFATTRYQNNDFDPRIVIGFLLLLKLVLRQPESAISWLRVTILEAAAVPQLSGHYPKLPAGVWLGLGLLVCVTTPNVPSSRSRLFALFALPMIALLLLRSVNE